MSDDDEYFERDEGPDEFDELDKLVEFAQGIIAKRKTAGEENSSPEYDASVQMIQLMIFEVTPRDIKISQQLGGGWRTEVLYKGITFVTVTQQEPEWETADDD